MILNVIADPMNALRDHVNASGGRASASSDDLEDDRRSHERVPR
jgi:hypothetical protein